jgi:dipeptidyl aminopeptidase/acylaminoacyl peptidase
MLALPAAATAEGKRPMQIEDLFRFKRVADPQVSPDGQWVAYTVTTVDLTENRTLTNIWLAPTASGSPRQLTNSTKHDRHPRWSPDSKQLVFESDRSGDSQLWVISVDGGEARQLTTIASEAGNAQWSPDGKWIAFVSAVFPEYSDKPYAESNAQNKKRKEEAEKNPVKAKVFTRLFFRHWDSWVEDKRQHLFVMTAAGSEPKDVTPGDRDAYPTSSTFETGDNYTFSPDSTHLVFTAVPARNEAWSTNYEICRVSILGGTIECLTMDNPAADSGPVYAPDGKHLAYRAQKRAGFEADKWDLMLVDCDATGAFKATPERITANLDVSVGEIVWQQDLRLLFMVESAGHTALYTYNLGGTPGPLAFFVPDGTLGSLSAPRSGGKNLFFTRARMSRPPEVEKCRLDRLLPANAPADIYENLSKVNDQLLAQLQLPHPESVTVPGAGGTPMQMWILKPPGFDPNKKWPLAYLVHGGPQGAWEDGWSFRWNPELWAAQGYVVALPNPRGSSGFGQKYVDEISSDWGGKCFDDLMAGVAYLEKQPYIDPERMAAAGASFGGYMMNWFQGHTTKFKTLITHCGVYNFDSMYATTEELWFDEWEHGGPPWGKNRHSYEKHSPHRFAQNFKTPMLIIHNDKDFRVPVSEGLQLFTTLQRQGIPSKMINFPDEGHWVLKPANSAYWHREVFAWLKQFVPPGGR